MGKDKDPFSIPILARVRVGRFYLFQGLENQKS